MQDIAEQIVSAKKQIAELYNWMYNDNTHYTSNCLYPNVPADIVMSRVHCTLYVIYLHGMRGKVSECLSLFENMEYNDWLIFMECVYPSFFQKHLPVDKQDMNCIIEFMKDRILDVPLWGTIQLENWDEMFVRNNNSYNINNDVDFLNALVSKYFMFVNNKSTILKKCVRHGIAAINQYIDEFINNIDKLEEAKHIQQLQYLIDHSDSIYISADKIKNMVHKIDLYNAEAIMSKLG